MTTYVCLWLNNNKMDTNKINWSTSPQYSDTCQLKSRNKLYNSKKKWPIYDALRNEFTKNMTTYPSNNINNSKKWLVSVTILITNSSERETVYFHSVDWRSILSAAAFTVAHYDEMSALLTGNHAHTIWNPEVLHPGHWATQWSRLRISLCSRSTRRRRPRVAA